MIISREALVPARYPTNSRRNSCWSGELCVSPDNVVSRGGAFARTLLFSCSNSTLTVNPNHATQKFDLTLQATMALQTSDDLLVCTNCGTQYAETANLPECRICEDPRQCITPAGQTWTTLKELKAKGHKNVFERQENDSKVVEIWTEPKVKWIPSDLWIQCLTALARDSLPLDKARVSSRRLMETSCGIALPFSTRTRSIRSVVTC